MRKQDLIQDQAHGNTAAVSAPMAKVGLRGKMGNCPTTVLRHYLQATGGRFDSVIPKAT
jgi:hypothetical protein